MAIRVQLEDFDIGAEIAALSSDKEIGAFVSFVGKVRQTTDGKTLQSMTLEHYPGMTEAELTRIEVDAIRRFNLTASLVVHRTGELHPGDNIVLVITCAPHRGDAFRACEYLMDYLKTTAPFWKKETDQKGEGRWVDARCSDADAMARWQDQASKQM